MLLETERPRERTAEPSEALGHAYASRAYARTLSHVGRPLSVPAWGTQVLLRPIPGAPGQVDAMGTYPVCVMAADADIAAGLETIRAAGAVSVVLVADPVCGPHAATLGQHFPLFQPFKTHYLLNDRAGLAALSKHHRDRVRRGERRATARLVSLRDPLWRGHWATLYGALVQRRGITGLQAFSTAAFDALALLPAEQLIAFAAEAPDGDVLAMHLWIRQGATVYSHLAAASDAGYRASASYLLYAAAITHFGDCATFDLGGGAGFADDADNSLALFKQGFANAAVPSMLCGAVLDPVAYAALAGARTGAFFPIYRTPG